MQLVIYGIIVLGVLGALFGAILAFASKIFYVEVDPKQEQVRECLAGANCGGCGFPGCDGYAAAVAKGEAPVNKCVAAGPEAAAKIAERQAMWKRWSLSFPARAPKAMPPSALTTAARRTARQQCCSAARATWTAALPASASATVQMPASSAQ